MDRQWLMASDLQFTLASASAITAPGPQCLPGAPDALRLLFVRNGSCDIIVGQTRESLAGDRMAVLCTSTPCQVDRPTGDLLLSQVDITYTSCPSGGFSLLQLYRQYPDYRSFCQENAPCRPFHDRFALVRFTAESLTQYTNLEPERRSALLAMALPYLMLVIASATQEKDREDYQYNRHIRRAIRYMHENYMRNITADEIAAHVGIHPGHLHRLFRTEMGTRVTEYLTRLRLEKAKTLLKRTDMPIGSIAYLVGVSTQQYLSRLFRQHIGMTPQTYRQSYNITCNYETAQAHYHTVVYPDTPPEQVENI